jgi:crossover junction endodeoxyribonuclease RusA
MIGLDAITLRLPYPLSANRYWRPVKIGAHITIVPTKEAKAYREAVAWSVSRVVRKPIVGRVAVTVQLYPKRPQDWAARARKDPAAWDDTVMCIDLDNANKVLLDALKGVAIEDDKWVRRLISERMEPDGDARVVVTITPLVLPAAARADLLGAAA